MIGSRSVHGAVTGAFGHACALPGLGRFLGRALGPKKARCARYIPLVFLMALPSGRTLAQFAGDGGLSADQAGDNLNAMLEALDLSASATLGVPCQQAFAALDAASNTALNAAPALECLVSTLKQALPSDQQGAALARLFQDRFLGDLSTLGLDVFTKDQGASGRDAEESFPVAYADLPGAPACPTFIDDTALVRGGNREAGGDIQLFLATPEGKRDLSPPLRVPQSFEHRLLAQALELDDPVAPLLQTACTTMRPPLARALFRTLLSLGRVAAAQDLANAPFMPHRYGRQMAGALGDQAAQEALKQTALARLFDAQAALSDPAAATEEISAILNEIERQFDIDFLMGQIWRADAQTLAELEFETAFIGAVARLLSQDAKLLQQGYGPQDVRFFYKEFFDALVTKGAFGLLRGLDLLVPEVMGASHRLALDARPIAPDDPTRFEENQEVLALLIRSDQREALAAIWPEVDTPQRQDAVLFAFDQGLAATGAHLYALIEEGDVSLDFLIRLSLYLTASQIDIGDGGQGDVK